MAQIINDRQNELGKWLCERNKAQYIPGQGYYIGIERNGKIVGVVGFDSFNGRSICMHVAAEGKFWINREYLWYVFWYPFEYLKVNKIIGLVASNNKDAMKFDLNLGFVHEATIKDACPDGDMNILTMTRKQCKFLTIRRP